MSCSEVETDKEAGVYNNQQWVDDWADGDTDFHQTVHDPVLDSHTEELFGGKIKSIFAPLCGKSPDLIWMYERGHTVCGVELAEQAVIELFQENNLTAEVEEIKDKGKLYKTKDGRLLVYCVDLFALDVATYGQFDVIWDSRSFVAINLADRESYVTLLLSLMKEGGRYFLYCLEFDPTMWPGPPHSTSDKDVHNAFGAKCNIQIIKEKELKPQLPPPSNPPSGQSSESAVGEPGEAKKNKTFRDVVGTLPSILNRWHLLTWK